VHALRKIELRRAAAARQHAEQRPQGALALRHIHAAQPHCLSQTRHAQVGGKGEREECADQDQQPVAGVEPAGHQQRAADRDECHPQPRETGKQQRLHHPAAVQRQERQQIEEIER